MLSVSNRYLSVSTNAHRLRFVPGQNGETKPLRKLIIAQPPDTGQNGQLPNNKQLSSGAALLQQGAASSPLQRNAMLDGGLRLPGRGQQMAPVSVEPHFMQQQQQQSQIFVFSTSWANKAAELVQQGQYGSVIEFHIDQPGTKHFLQVSQCNHFFFFYVRLLPLGVATADFRLHCVLSSGAETIKKKKNLTQNKSQTQRARAYEVTSFLSTDCELSTEHRDVLKKRLLARLTKTVQFKFEIVKK